MESEDQAAGYTRSIRANPEVWEGRGVSLAPVVVGERLSLGPCVPPTWPLATADKPCPRVSLWGENATAAELVMASLPEHTRPLMPGFWRAKLREVPRTERRRVLVRAVNALHSAGVVNWLMPPRPEEDRS